MRFLLLILLGACFFPTIESKAQPFGLTNRVGNTTLRLPSSVPVYGYTTATVFASVSISAPIGFATPPGETNRLFILERAGRVVVITNLAAPTRTVFLDISSRVTTSGEEGLLGIAFHPNYAVTPYFYLFYSLSTNTAAGSGRHQRLSRFETSSVNTNLALSGSELPLITQRDDLNNHNGGDLHFGPDGYLYIALGDEGDANDTGANSQRIDKDFFAGILRIDVDKLGGNLPPTPHAALMGATNYFVPADNPFVGTNSFNGLPINTNALRTEFWAVGLRNPWRMAFDSETGVLYCGDVGQGAREEIDVIIKGGNYGWNYREGTIARPGSGAPPAGFRPVEPITDYMRGTATNQGNSVTGGRVYRGTRIPQLTGKYIFADYISGNVWALTPNGTNPVPFQFLTDDPNLVAFGVDPRNGDILVADIAANQVKRLDYLLLSGTPFPATLADTGAFADLESLTPQPGLVPYEVNIPGWSDNAIIRRWHYFPTNRTIIFRPTNNWSSPTGSVWIQHLELELTNGVPESRRPVETRFIVRDSSSGILGFSYRWGDSTTNATLSPEEGMNEMFTIYDGDTPRNQDWRYPSRADCASCHTTLTQGGLAIGFNTFQLNRNFDYSGIVDNQLRAMSRAGYFSAPVTNMNSLRALAPLADETQSVEARVRSYLTANCVHCHQTGGTGTGLFDTRLNLTLPSTFLVNGALVDSLGNPDNRVVKPGSLAESMLLTRISTLGVGRMPPRGSSVLDSEAISLLSRWITNNLPEYETFSEWQTNHFGSTNAPEAAPGADIDLDLASNTLEYLTHTDPNQAGDAWSISLERTDDQIQIVYPRLADRGFEVQWNTNITNTAGWRALDVPENRPVFSSSNGTGRVPDVVAPGPAKSYRVRVYAP